MKEDKATEQEVGIVLPDDASKVDQVQAADRLLAFDGDGNPTAPTAEQLKEFTTEGLVDTEAMNTALAKKANAPATLQNADLNTLTSNGLYVADGTISNAPASTANCRVLVIATSPYRVTQIAQVYDADRLFFRRRIDEQWQSWRELWHAGNLAPATASAAGLMSAEDRVKLNSVASALSLSVVTEDTPTTLEETDEDTTRVMAVTSQACIRAQRAAQYQMQTDELLYDALEAFARNHPEYSEFAAWLEAKDRIRQELPKPEVTEAAGGTEPAAERKGGEG